MPPSTTQDRYGRLAVAEIAKEIRPEATVIIGGPQVSIFLEEGLHSPAVDMVVISEGEIIIRNVKNTLGDEEKLRDVPGIWFRTEDGSIVKNSKEKLIEDMDIIPMPALNLFPMKRYSPTVHIHGKNVMSMMTSRGYPFACTFCNSKLTFGRGFRYHSTKRVIEELKVHVRMGYDSFQFYDDIFTTRRDRVIELCEAILREKLKIKWMCVTWTNVVDPILLGIMKKAGCYPIAYGCEAGDEGLLRQTKKALTVEKNRHGLAITREVGILTQSFFMLWLPTETPELSEKTIRFAFEADVDYALFVVTEPIPSTEMWDDIEDYGSFDDTGRYQNELLNEHSSVWVPHGRTHTNQAF